MKWLKRRLQKWLEIDNTLGKAGFESINYKGLPVGRDDSSQTAVFEEGEFRKYVSGQPAIDTSGELHTTGLYTDTTSNTGVLSEDFLENTIKKGYERAD